jgi:hypothetical protein
MGTQNRVLRGEDGDEERTPFAEARSDAGTALAWKGAPRSVHRERDCTAHRELAWPLLLHRIERRLQCSFSDARS